MGREVLTTSCREKCSKQNSGEVADLHVGERSKETTNRQTVRLVDREGRRLEVATGVGSGFVIFGVILPPSLPPPASKHAPQQQTGCLGQSSGISSVSLHDMISSARHA